MTPVEIYAKLKKIAPSIAFGASWESDPSFEWDGDGPDPEEDGMFAVDVTVSAEAIVSGEKIVGNAYLGGHYIEPGEELGDISGYLPQMLEDAAKDLADQLPEGSPLKAEIAAVLDFLKAEMRRRYDDQRTEIEASRG